jgi:hypothetical protein
MAVPRSPRHPGAMCRQTKHPRVRLAAADQRRRSQRDRSIRAAAHHFGERGSQPRAARALVSLRSQHGLRSRIDVAAPLKTPMTRAHLLTIAAIALSRAAARPAAAQEHSQIDLVVGGGTPLRIALDDTVALTCVGQVVNGTLVEPVYAYDRVVLSGDARRRPRHGRSRILRGCRGSAHGRTARSRRRGV